MITPGYSPTATERVLPRMALDFTTASLDSRVTVTRALNTATRVNSSGYIETVNANLPRFDFSPTSVGTCRGLLIEESRENICLYSEQLNQLPWTASNASIVNDAVVSPSNVQNADLIREDTATSTHYASTSTIASAAGTYTVSLYAKAAGRTKFRIQQTVTTPYAVLIDLTAQTATTVVGGATGTVTDAGNGFFRCTMTYTTSVSIALSTVIYMANDAGSISYAGNGASGLYVWGVQLELGAFATSYIPTTTTSLTRNADVVSMTGTNFSSWYVSSSAALAAVVTPSLATGTRPIWQLDDTTANEIIALRGNVANPELYIVDGGAPQAQLDAGTIIANTQYGLCAAFATNSCAVSQNGATPVTTATATMPTVTQARIGSDGSNFLNGAVRTLRYWPQRVLNAEAQAFSKV